MKAPIRKMLFLLLWWKYYQAIFLLCLSWSSEGLNLDASFSSSTEKISTTPANHSHSMPGSSHQTPLLETFGTLLESSPSLATQSLDLLSSGIFPSKSADDKASLTNSSSESYPSTEAMDTFPTISNSPVLNSTTNSSSSDVTNGSVFHPADTLPSSTYKSNIFQSYLRTSNYITESLQKNVFSLKSDEVSDTDLFTHFHTPLMSLLVATPSSSSWPTIEPTQTASHFFNNPAKSLTTSSSDNESSDPNHLPVPTDQDHKKLLMLVLRAEDCSKFSKSDFEKMLSKLMAKFGFNDVIPEVSNAKCYSHLTINVTVGGPTPTLRFLPNMDGKNNYTVDVLNRTFRIIKLEKVDFKLEKTKFSNASSNIIAAVAKHESVAYIAVGVSFGLILVICVSVCCIKCCCLRKPQKRYGVPKGAHVRLRPEDYTLTPIPRPASLYVDYYRGSGTADIYSTTSAGSIASTTPTVEQGVVQPFDTSIVPLEDSSNLPIDTSRDPSVESVPVQSDLKTFNMHSLSGKGFRTASTDSKEQLNPKAHSRRVEIKPSGVANPTFQRY